MTGVTQLTYTKHRTLERFSHIIGILEVPVLYFCGYFIDGSSGTAVGGKGLICSRFNLVRLELIIIPLALNRVLQPAGRVPVPVPGYGYEVGGYGSGTGGRETGTGRVRV